MKCLTIKQYWAWAIVAGHKRVENRTWSTTHRGPLAIHAGRSIDEESRAILATAGIDVPENVASGAIIGAVDVVACVPHAVGQQRLTGIDDEYKLADDPLATGPFCWILRNPRPLSRPVPMRGRPGLFDVSDKEFHYG